jgi:hypothetical protein
MGNGGVLLETCVLGVWEEITEKKLLCVAHISPSWACSWVSSHQVYLSGPGDRRVQDMLQDAGQ